VTSCKKLIEAVLIVWFTASQAWLGAGAALAQGQPSRMDVEPPLIEHEVVINADSDYRQSFVATVVDDVDLDSVRLFYRFAGEPAYGSVQMRQVSSSSTYIAQIPTDPSSDVSIEYYLQAQDVSGNRTLRGYAFNPLVRSVNVPEPLLANPSTPAEAGVEVAAATTTEEAKPRSKALYIVGGALLLGLVAGALSASGGGSSSSGGASCPDGVCNVGITLAEPLPE